MTIIQVFFLLSTAEAQQCTSYTIYKDNFGGNMPTSAVGQPLPSNVTTYTFTDKIPIEDGFYSIRKVSKGYNTWHHMSDHTGNGYMMIVNASYDPGLFYQKTITGLCQGSSFNFSVFVANLMKLGAGGDKDPSLKFVIKDPQADTIIAELSTGLLPRYTQPTWDKYGIQFDLPIGLSSVILQIFNNADGGAGNDLALDDISFSICGPPLNYNVSGMYLGSSNVCVGEEVKLEASISNSTYQHPEYQWQFSSDSIHWDNLSGKENLTLHFNNIHSSDSGWYRILASEQGNILKEKCRISSPAIPVRVWDQYQPKIVTNSPICEGDTLNIDIQNGPYLNIQWNGPNSFSSNKKELTFSDAQPSFSGTYKVNTVNPGGCKTSQTKNVKVQKNALSVSFNPLDSIICEGERRILDAENSGASYLWSTGATTPQINIDTGGWYDVNVQRGACSVSDTIHLYSIKKPKVHLGTDTLICIGQPYILDATYPDVENYLWNNGSRDSSITISQAGIYSVQLKNYCGIAKDAVQIDVGQCADILLFPTAFTPNEDGKNDIFRPIVFFSIANYHLSVFNRWGKMIFQSSNPNNGWDGSINGKPAPTGSYVWQVSYKRLADQQEKKQQGVITLIR